MCAQNKRADANFSDTKSICIFCWKKTGLGVPRRKGKTLPTHRGDAAEYIEKMRSLRRDGPQKIAIWAYMFHFVPFNC